MAPLYHLESYKHPKWKSSRSFEFCYLNASVLKGKAESEMKLYRHVHVISATRANKSFSEKLQESLTICISTFTEFIQGRVLRAMIFHNSLAIEQYLLAKNFTIDYNLVSFPIKSHKMKKHKAQNPRLCSSINVFK